VTLNNAINYRHATLLQAFFAEQISVLDIARALAQAAGSHHLAAFDADLAANNIGVGILAEFVNRAETVLEFATENARARRRSLQGP
jgi:hypothetical protein